MVLFLAIVRTSVPEERALLKFKECKRWPSFQEKLITNLMLQL
jgi:hypothetical protein